MSTPLCWLYLDITDKILTFFEFSDLYLNIGNKFVFVTESLVMDAFGHIMIDSNGFEGDIYFDGVLALEGLSFDVDLDLMGGNLTSN